MTARAAKDGQKLFWRNAENLRQEIQKTFELRKEQRENVERERLRLENGTFL